MPDLAYRQQKIQEKRKQTSFRDFLKEIASWFPLNIYRVDGMLSRYPDTERKGIVVPDQYASMNNDQIGEYTGDFFADFACFEASSKKSNLIFFGSNENADYTDSGFWMKNCYLSFWLGNDVINGLYSVVSSLHCSDIINSLRVLYNSSNIFESRNIRQSFNVFYSTNIDNSSDLWFCSNCVGCHNCIDCSDLENKSYCINNQQFTKEGYSSQKSHILHHKQNFITKKNSTFSKIGNINSTNTTGVGIINSANIINGYLVSNAQDSRNVALYEGGEHWSDNVYDSIHSGVNASHLYATVKAGTNSEHLYCFIFGGFWCSFCYYSMNLEACSFCFGCIGLINKHYCIFNKEYRKEERYIKVNEIFTQMEKDWTLWKFFPARMNPFYFNDTAAYLIDPSFTKEEVERAGYLRRDEPIKVDIPEDAELVKVSDLDKYEGYDENGKWRIDEEILKKVIIDEEGNVRRIVNMEYVFLMKYGLPLPRKHRLERMKENFRIG